MARRGTKFWFWRLPFFILSAAVFSVSGCGEKMTVDVAKPKKGSIVESFSEPAKTRLRVKYPITMPVDGRIGRVTLEPGDQVKKGQTLAAFDRVPVEESVRRAQAAVSEFGAELTVMDNNELEKTVMEESLAVIKASLEALKASDQQVAAEQARKDRSDKHYNRMRNLVGQGAIPQSQMDDAALSSETSLIELRQQQFYRAALNAIIVAVKLGPKYVDKYLEREKLQRAVTLQRLKQAQASLAQAKHNLALANVVSPIDGVVLERYELGDSMLPAGKRLLLLGNLADLQVVAEVLTQDALKLSKGTEVELSTATGRKPIKGKVLRVNPAGFTKKSSLGVDQQRVKVVVAIPVNTDRALGVGYRVQARFKTAFKKDALLVPRYSVLQAPDRTFYVLQVVSGRLKRTPVTIGLKNDLDMEILTGLTPDDRIVSRPDSEMSAEMEVSPR